MPRAGTYCRLVMNADARARSPHVVNRAQPLPDLVTDGSRNRLPIEPRRGDLRNILMNADGTAQTASRITPRMTCTRRVARRRQDSFGSLPEVSSQIYVMNVNGTARRAWRRGRPTDTFPALVSGRSRIAFEEQPQRQPSGISLS